MSKQLASETRVLPLFLKDIFPLCNLSPSKSGKDQIVNAAYTKLFKDLIPGFKAGEVHFVLAEVLELDREESRPRILVYSNRRKKGVKDLLSKYFEVIGSLREDEWSISKTDALYTGSRIWCAETHSAECQVTDDKRRWIVDVTGTLPRGYEFQEGVDEKKEVEEIRSAFVKYIKHLYDLHLKNYPFAYVMLIPIFLGSMYGKKKSRKKLGAIFLHFATTKRVADERALLRLYSRTLLFWHYYFTSEAIDRRQDLLDASDREKKSLEVSHSLLKKIRPSLDDIRYKLEEIRKPLFELEAELNPARVILFGEGLSRFFMAGPPIYILNGKQEITPKHDWTAGAVEVYKTLIAGVLIKGFQLEDEVEEASEKNLWARVSSIIDRKANKQSQPFFKELIKSLPNLLDREPHEHQVEETFKIIKSWYSDAFKPEKGIPGLPITMLELMLRVLGCDFQKGTLGSNTFWVASEPPARTIGALGILHEKHGLKEAHIGVSKETIKLDTITSCELKLVLERSHSEASRKGANLERLRQSLDESLAKRIVPGGNTTRFLWTICGQHKLTLNGTIFSWKEDNCEFSLDFIEANGKAKEMVITWKGEINE